MAELLSNASVALAAAAATDVGCKREANEDAVLAASGVFLVADGMGGHDAGDLASAAIVDAFRRLDGRALVPDDITDALDAAQDAVAALAAETHRGAGSTVAGIALVDVDDAPHWLVFHVGDSRVYRYADGALERLTVDHSLGQAMVEAGRLHPDDVDTFAKRNVITRAIGASEHAADLRLRPVVSGERLLICSDGLTGEIADDGIRAALARGETPDATVAALIDEAKDAGGRDNIAVVVIDVAAQEDTP